MSELRGKIDFLVLVSATEANPNGDPLNGNRPRENFDGYGTLAIVSTHLYVIFYRVHKWVIFISQQNP